MNALFVAAWGQPDLIWLAFVVFVAGIVRGFAGFGTALIYVPVAANFLSPVWVLITLMAIDLVGPLPLVPRALKDGSKVEISAMLLGCALALPFGVYVLTWIEPQVFRWLVSLLALGVVALLLSGWRHRVMLQPRSLMGIGAVGGFLGGFSGMPGPPVILAYMSGQYEPARIRANTLLFLLGFDFMLAVAFVVQGVFVLEAFVLGVLLILPYGAGNLIGARIFNPDNARTYRLVAYVVIVSSALIGLPVFD